MKRLLFASLFIFASTSAGAVTGGKFVTGKPTPPTIFDKKCDPEIDWCILAHCEEREGRERDCQQIPIKDLEIEVKVCLDMRTIIKPVELIRDCKFRVNQRIKEYFNPVFYYWHKGGSETAQ